MTTEKAPDKTGPMTPTEWTKLTRAFNTLMPIARTPLNVPLGTKSEHDDLFIGARVALDARLERDKDMYQNPLLLMKQKTGRMAVALQQAQYGGIK